MQEPQSVLQCCVTGVSGGHPVMQSGMSCVEAAFQAQEVPAQDPSCCLSVRELQALCSSFAFNSLPQLAPLQIYLLGGLLGSWTLQDRAKGCTSLCGRGITDITVLLQKWCCFVKEKLSKTRAETYATHLTCSLSNARKSQGWYTVYSILCLLCLNCKYFRAGTVLYPLNKQQLQAWRKLKRLSQLAYFSMPEEPGCESSQ